MLKLQEKFPAAWKACVTKETVPGKCGASHARGDE